MALRAYFLPMTGTGTSVDAIRPTIPAGIDWTGHALPSSGLGFVLADVTPVQHTTIVATVGAQYLPFEDTLGNLLTGADTFGTVSTANRTTLRTILEGQHVPTQQFQGSDPIRRAIMAIKRRLLVRQELGADDWTEGLDTLVSAMTAARRQAINAKLQSWGYDTSTVQLTDTIRQAIVKILVQTVRANRTGDE